MVLIADVNIFKYSEHAMWRCVGPCNAAYFFTAAFAKVTCNRFSKTQPAYNVIENKLYVKCPNNVYHHFNNIDEH
jgi:hypothetical protein